MPRQKTVSQPFDEKEARERVLDSLQLNLNIYWAFGSGTAFAADVSAWSSLIALQSCGSGEGLGVAVAFRLRMVRLLSLMTFVLVRPGGTHLMPVS